jgi:hypothetical protein
MLPDAWLENEDAQVYVDYLSARLEASRGFAEEAEHARS